MDLYNGFGDETAALPVFDFHNPDVGVDAQLFCEIFRRVLFVAGLAQRREPNRFLSPARLTEHHAGSIQPVNFEKNRPRFFGAMPHKIGGSSRGLATANQRLNVNRTFEPDHGITLPSPQGRRIACPLVS